MTDHLAMVGYRANINQLKDGWWGLRFKVPVGEGGNDFTNGLEVLGFFWGVK